MNDSPSEGPSTRVPPNNVLPGNPDDWPSAMDSLPMGVDDPPNYHHRKLHNGYPLMGSSPAEVAEARQRTARLKAEAMRQHAFEGEGQYCTRVQRARNRTTDSGTLTFTSQCGYPIDMHHERVVTTPTGWLVNSGALGTYDQAYRFYGDRASAMAELEDQAGREDWARARVARAGKDWRTHGVKFDGTVWPRW